jgi:hypothetical protein
MQYDPSTLAQLIFNFLSTLICHGLNVIQYITHCAGITSQLSHYSQIFFYFIPSIHIQGPFKRLCGDSWRNSVNTRNVEKTKKTANWSFVKTVDIFLLSIFPLSAVCRLIIKLPNISARLKNFGSSLSSSSVAPPPPSPQWYVGGSEGGGGDGKKQQQDASVHYLFSPTKKNF